MRYLSLFSGIEAASVAWKSIGWKCVGVAEIEPFANATLAHHYPNTQNLGSVVDLRDQLLAGEDVAGLLSRPPDVVVGGSPCQAFSVAGSRQSLDDHRGNLTLVYAEIIDAICPEFVVWENVPGVLSTKDNAFGHLLGRLAGHGDAIPVSDGHRRWSNAGVVAGPKRTLAWRVLDAQYFGVPQRRRRVFLVGCSAASGRDPSEILFERQSLQGNSASRGKTRKDVAQILSARTKGGGLQPKRLRQRSGEAGGLGTDFDLDDGLVPSVSPCLTSNYGKQPDNSDTSKGPMLIPVSVSMRTRDGHAIAEVDETGIAPALRAGQGGSSRNFIIAPQKIAGTLKVCAKSGGWSNSVDHAAAGMMIPVYGAQHVAFAENSRSEIRLEGGDGRRTGALTTGDGKPGQGTPMMAFDGKAGGNTSFSIGDKPGTMRGGGHGGGHLAVAHTLRAEGFDASEDGTGRGIPLVPVWEPVWAVRRLTPIECARLQGFPDHYLDITYRNKPAADGNKYKALGNSMAVPVMAWLGQRIQQHVRRKDPAT